MPLLFKKRTREKLVKKVPLGTTWLKFIYFMPNGAVTTLVVDLTDDIIRYLCREVKDGRWNLFFSVERAL